MAFEIDYGKVVQTEAELKDKIKEIVGENDSGGGFDILWQQTNSPTSFTEQNIPISVAVSDYRFYEVMALRYPGSSVALDKFTMISTGKVPVGFYGELFHMINGTTIELRYVGLMEAGLYVGTNKKYTINSSSSSVENSRNIPYMVLGYK